MRLVINSRNCNAGAGVNRYKGEGVYGSLHRKNTSLIKVTNTKEEDEDPGLDKKLEGKAIDAVDSNTVECKRIESDEESCVETISNSTEDENVIDDKESNIDNDEEPVIDDKEISVDNDEESVSNDKEGIVDDDVNKVTPASGVKRQFPASFVDSIINEGSDEWTQPKIRCWDTSFLESREKDNSSTSSNVDECDIQSNELLKDKKEDHSLIKIPPTKRKKYSQKACVHCRVKYGIRNDTRYICTICNVALCQEPCFSDYHCNK